MGGGSPRALRCWKDDQFVEEVSLPGGLASFLLGDEPRQLWAALKPNPGIYEWRGKTSPLSRKAWASPIPSRWRWIRKNACGWAPWMAACISATARVSSKPPCPIPSPATWSPFSCRTAGTRSGLVA